METLVIGSPSFDQEPRMPSTVGHPVNTIALLLRLVDRKLREESGGQVHYLKQTRRDLHSAFFRAQEEHKDQFADLERLHFTVAGGFPYSSELAEAMAMLQMSGSLSRENPSLERFTVAPTDEEKLAVQESEYTGQSATALHQIVDMLAGELRAQ